MKKTHIIRKEVKEQIIDRIKNKGVTVVDAAKEHGISPKTIHNWLRSSVVGGPTVLEFNKLQRENKALLEIIGKLTVDLSTTQKND